MTPSVGSPSEVLADQSSRRADWVHRWRTALEALSARGLCGRAEQPLRAPVPGCHTEVALLLIGAKLRALAGCHTGCACASDAD